MTHAAFAIWQLVIGQCTHTSICVPTVSSLPECFSVCVGAATQDTVHHILGKDQAPASMQQIESASKQLYACEQPEAASLLAIGANLLAPQQSQVSAAAIAPVDWQQNALYASEHSQVQLSSAQHSPPQAESVLQLSSNPDAPGPAVFRAGHPDPVDPDSPADRHSSLLSGPVSGEMLSNTQQAMARAGSTECDD